MSNFIHFHIFLAILAGTLFTNVTFTQAAPRQRRSTDVSIFAHDNFRGRTLTYSLGSRCRNLMGSFRNSVTSIRVSSGCVQLCRLDYCSECTVVRESYADLRDIDLNDQIRSIRRCDDDHLFEYLPSDSQDDNVLLLDESERRR